MAKVKVWNDHKIDHVEKFKNETIRIPAGGYVEMDYIDAIDFKGQFFGMKMLGPNNPDPKSFKMIRVEEPAEPVVKEDPNVFHATGKSAQSREEMIAFAKAYAAMNPDLAVSEPDLDKRGPSNAALQAQIEELKALLGSQQARAKPGPKPKQRATA